MVRLDLDGFLVRKIREGRNTKAGKYLHSLSVRMGGVTRLAVLNIILTATLGFIIAYPLHITVGFHAAVLPAVVTIIPISVIFICILNYNIGSPVKEKTLRLPLMAAIFLSLPFSVFSLPLLYSMSEK